MNKKASPKTRLVTQEDKWRVFNMVGYEPHPVQVLIHKSNARFRLLVCGVRTGKTWCAAAEALAALLFIPGTEESPSVGWIVGPSHKTANHVFKRLWYMVHKNKQIRSFIASGTTMGSGSGTGTIRIKHGDNVYSEVYRMSTQSYETLPGETLDWVIVDEAAMVPEDIWNTYIRSRLITTEGWGVLLTTPKGKNWIYERAELARRNDPEWALFQARSTDSPYVTDDEIKKIKEQLTPWDFAQQYEGVFISGGGEVFRNLSEIEDSSLRLHRNPSKGMTYYMGVDLGKTDNPTAITILNQRGELVYLEISGGVGYDEQLKYVAELAKKWNDAITRIDSSGAAGQMALDLLRGNIQPRIAHLEGYDMGSNKTKNELIEILQNGIARRRITIPPFKSNRMLERLRYEMESFSMKITDSGYKTYHAPKNKTDDLIDALGLSYWGIVEQPNMAKTLGADAFWIEPLDSGQDSEYVESKKRNLSRFGDEGGTIWSLKF